MAWRGVLVPEELIERLDAHREANPGRWTSRAELVRDILNEHLDARARAPRPAPVVA
jgi:Arc/MetJ-type ribon-helix-helix transcriptional regulator